LATELPNLEQPKISHIIEIWENLSSSNSSID